MKRRGKVSALIADKVNRGMRGRANIRKFGRKKFPANIRVSYQDRCGNDKYGLVRAFDISENGLSLELPEPVELRSYVTLRAERLGLQGRASVRHCGRHGNRYLVGLEFAGLMRWSAPSPEVQQLLDAANALAPDAGEEL